MRTLLTVIVLGLAHPALQPPVDSPRAVPPSTQAASAPEEWKGKISLPGMALDFGLVLTRPAGDAPAAATMSLPMQGLKDAALRDVQIKDGRFRFTLGIAPMPEARWAHFDLELSADQASAEGTMTQAGISAKVTMRRAAPGEAIGPTRPQTPAPPWPYAHHDVTFDNPADGTRLAGTLTIPEEAKFGPGSFPAALLITGSGAQDRDETIFGHKPFAVIADHLTRAGIAVLRVDDRGVGGSTSPKEGKETTDDFAGDARAGVAFLRTRGEIDPARIGLIGHSEGGLIAAMAAADDPRIAFVVMLAGPSVPGIDVLREQLKAGLRAMGLHGPAIERQSRAQQFALEGLVAGKTDEEMRPLVDALVREQVGLGGLDEIPDAAREGYEVALAAGMAQVASPWMRRYIALDPRGYLRRLRCPVLALFGEKDTQVLADQNHPALDAALEQAANRDVTAVTIPGVNHLFQTCRTGAVPEYAVIEETIAPAVLDRIADWVREKTADRKNRP